MREILHWNFSEKRKNRTISLQSHYPIDWDSNGIPNSALGVSFRKGRLGTGTAQKVFFLLTGRPFSSWTTSPTLNWLDSSCAWYLFLCLTRLLYFGCGASRVTSTATVLSLVAQTTFPCNVFIALITNRRFDGGGAKFTGFGRVREVVLDVRLLPLKKDELRVRDLNWQVRSIFGDLGVFFGEE